MAAFSGSRQKRRRLLTGTSISLKSPNKDWRRWLSWVPVPVLVAPAQVGQSSRQHQGQRRVEAAAGQGPFCLEADPRSIRCQRVEGWGQGWRLITDIREVVG